MKHPSFRFQLSPSQLQLIGDALLDMIGGPDAAPWPLEVFEGRKHREMCMSIAPQVWRKCNRAYTNSQKYIRFHGYEMSVAVLAVCHYHDLPVALQAQAREVLSQMQPKLIAS